MHQHVLRQLCLLMALVLHVTASRELQGVLPDNVARPSGKPAFSPDGAPCVSCVTSSIRLLRATPASVCKLIQDARVRVQALLTTPRKTGTWAGASARSM